MNLNENFTGVWQPIETAPKDGTYIILGGDSGYSTTPMRAEIGHWDAEYRPKNPWQTHSDDAFTDGGEPPTHWMPLPPIPDTAQTIRTKFTPGTVRMNPEVKLGWSRE